tara:strand:- start:4122 stop:4418 length:297 start_codon:yes stop_codon:yes gene_type:complete
MKFSNKNKINIYFLIYKLNSHPKLWIVKVTNNINIMCEFKTFIYDVFSNIDKYYLVKRQINEEEFNSNTTYKNFTNFKFLRKDIILYESCINKYYLDY